MRRMPPHAIGAPAEGPLIEAAPACPGQHMAMQHSRQQATMPTVRPRHAQAMPGQSFEKQCRAATSRHMPRCRMCVPGHGKQSPCQQGYEMEHLPALLRGSALPAAAGQACQCHDAPRARWRPGCSMPSSRQARAWVQHAAADTDAAGTIARKHTTGETCTGTSCHSIIPERATRTGAVCTSTLLSHLHARPHCHSHSRSLTASHSQWCTLSPCTSCSTQHRTCH